MGILNKQTLILLSLKITQEIKQEMNTNEKEDRRTMGEKAGAYIDRAHVASVEAKDAMVGKYDEAVERGSEMKEDSGSWLSRKYEGKHFNENLVKTVRIELNFPPYF